MIYDGHVYCVPDQRSRMGFATREEYMKHLQWGMALNFQPAWRARDGAPGDSSGIYDPSLGQGPAALKECDFRPAGHGRYEWAVDGEDYARQAMPPTNVVNGSVSLPANSMIPSSWSPRWATPTSTGG